MKGPELPEPQKNRAGANLVIVGGTPDRPGDASPRPILKALPRLNMWERTHKWTVCRNCGGDFEQRISGKKFVCPSCKGVKPK